MKQELYWLTLTCLMTAIFWMPYVLGRFAEFGIFKVLMDGNADMSTQSAWAKRAIKAHKNAVENLVIFSTLVVVIVLSGQDSATTASAASIYFFSRLAHFVVYTAGFPIIRTVSFLVGFACQLVLALVALGLM